MKKKHFICFAAIAIALAAIILFIYAMINDRELLLEDLWKWKEISQIVIVSEEKGASGTVLSEEEMSSFISDFGSEKITRIHTNDRITGWTHGVRMYDKNGNQVVFITFLGTRISAADNGFYQCTTSIENLYSKLALYEEWFYPFGL